MYLKQESVCCKILLTIFLSKLIILILIYQWPNILLFSWPFYCKNCQKNGTASSLAIYLGDAMLAYLIALNATYTKYGINQLRNTSAIMEYFSVTRPEMPCKFFLVFTL